MLAPFDFYSPQRIVFGWGCAEVGEAAKSLGRKALLVVGSRTLERSGIVDELRRLLTVAGVESVHLASIRP
ncbi:MAG: iron-containing alcohol dehydrogenase [Pirellulales bacterium]